MGGTDSISCRGGDPSTSRMGGNHDSSSMDSDPGTSRMGGNRASRMGANTTVATFPDSGDDNTWTSHAATAILSTTTSTDTLPAQPEPRQPSCLDNFDTRALVFIPLCHVALQEAKLHDIITSVINKTVAQAWTINTGYIFLDGHLYIPAALPLLLALINALISGDRIHNLKPPVGGVP